MTNDATLPRPFLLSAWLRFLDAPLAQASGADVAIASVGAGMLFDLAMRSGVATVAGALCITAVSVALLVTRRAHNPQAIALVAAAPVFGFWLLFRTSAWLIPFNILAAAGLLGFGASLSRGGSGIDMTIPQLAARVVRGGLQLLWAPAYVFRGVFGRLGERRAGGVARGLLLLTPLVLILGALLTSADAVFASFFDFEMGEVPQHAASITIGTLGMAALLRLASAEPAAAPQVEGPRLGYVESAMVLVSLNLLLAAFAVARLVALSEGGRRVLSSAGLTYAEYARSGFFQLLFAAVIVVAVLLALRATADLSTPRRQRTFAGLSLGVVVLTLAVCVSAFHRLVLYESVFGMTMLRLYVQTAIVWVAFVVAAVGVAVAIGSVRRAWLAPAAALFALVLLFALNVLDPEAFVARHNVSHPANAARFDATYLTGLSDDAVPAIASRALENDDVGRSLRESICAGALEDGGGWASYNVARERAGELRSGLC
jgi:hypothetical protein